MLAYMVEMPCIIIAELSGKAEMLIRTEGCGIPQTSYKLILKVKLTCVYIIDSQGQRIGLEIIDPRVRNTIRYSRIRYGFIIRNNDPDESTVLPNVKRG